MAEVKLTNLTKLQANAIAMWAEIGGLTDAFNSSKEAELITNAGGKLLDDCDGVVFDTESIYEPKHEVTF
jgi:hypothetical protein